MKVFISYSHSDSELVRSLVDVLAKEGHSVWYADDQVQPGENLARKAAKAIESSDAMVLVLTADSSKSPWVQREMDYALGSTRYRNRLVTVVADKNVEVPWILKKFPVIEVNRKDLASVGRRVASELREVAPK